MIGDTILAVASPPGVGHRGILRLSGPDALAIAGDLIGQELTVRAALDCEIEVMGSPVECLAMVMPGPRSYTGEDIVELHLPGSPYLLDHLSRRLRSRARDATAGEFTRRAWENGRLDLARAEAVLALIHAADTAERRSALAVLRGGLSAVVDESRSLIQDSLALVESGLDFTEGETGQVERRDWIGPIEGARGRIVDLIASLPPVRAGGELLLVGAANAGKSSLCNALAGQEMVLVSDHAGTTRDVVSVELAPGVNLLDAPGDIGDAPEEEVAALEFTRRVGGRGGGAVLVIDRSDPKMPGTELPVVAVVFTKADLPAGPVIGEVAQAPSFSVSSHSGEGIEEFRHFLTMRRGGGPQAGHGHSLDCLQRAEESLATACDRRFAALPQELLAVELGRALAALDEIHGRSSAEDLLDRIFGHFCLGK
ncbi:MAG: 50S ribosome-binding GTPase [Planctomycetota bacterium]|jgi:tRNA modification GTPase|nr:50S ribosome-binding GTPase [Planctomycetota bacterium]